MEQFRKFIRRLPASERPRVEAAVIKIVSQQLDQLDVKKLAGTKNCYRVRVGLVRIVFLQNNKQEPEIISVSFRSEKTYRDL